MSASLPLYPTPFSQLQHFSTPRLTQALSRLGYLSARMNSDLPESLTIALDARHLNQVDAWWSQLTESERLDFLSLANSASQATFESMESTTQDDDETNDWFEYVVNQDVRFYFDTANGQQTSHGWMSNFTMTPIGLAADAQVISHVLSRPKRK